MVELKEIISSQTIEKCISCGLTLDREISKIEHRSGTLNKLENLCSACTSNNTRKPIFKSIVYGISDGYFIEKMGFKKFAIALKKGWDLVTKLPYWQAHKSEWIDLDTLLNESISTLDDLWMNSDIFTNLEVSEDPGFMSDRPDIFISHSWNGPDKTLVEPLVDALKNLGYSVWYDKEQGLKPGELEEYLKRQELAKERDHRRLGKKLDLFSIQPQTAGPGLIFWHPKGDGVA